MRSLDQDPTASNSSTTGTPTADPTAAVSHPPGGGRTGGTAGGGGGGGVATGGVGSNTNAVTTAGATGSAPSNDGACVRSQPAQGTLPMYAR